MVRLIPRKIFYVLFCCLLAGTGCREADPGLNLMGGAEFLQKAAAFDVFGVQSGQLATQKAQLPAVGQFGSHLVTDHTHSHELVRDLANRKNIILPDSMRQEQMAVRDHLRGLAGEEFDRMFILKQIQAHEEALFLYQQASVEVPDRQIQKWSQERLPMLQQHLDRARFLRTLIER